MVLSKLKGTFGALKLIWVDDHYSGRSFPWGLFFVWACFFMVVGMRLHCSPPFVAKQNTDMSGSAFKRGRQSLPFLPLLESPLRTSLAFGRHAQVRIGIHKMRQIFNVQVTIVPFFFPRAAVSVAPISSARRLMLLSPMPRFLESFLGRPMPLS